MQDGLNKGWQKLHWEIYKEIIDRKCLLSMRHSSHKGNDDCLHEGERIHFVLTGLFLLGRICLAALACLSLSSMLKAQHPETKARRLPKLGIRIKRQLLLRDKRTRRVALLNESKQLCEWRSEGMADLEQILYEVRAHLFRDMTKINPP